MFFTDLLFEILVFLFTGWLSVLTPPTQIQLINGG
jgi:hypothetical protein